METVATSVRIAGDAIDILSTLTTKLGQSKAQVIEIALKELEERIFWAEVADAFDQIATDSQEAAVQKAEIELWEQGTARDYKSEEW